MSLYSIGITLVDAVLGLLTRRTHQHTARIPAQGPFVVVGNHVSLSDPLVLASALRRGGRRVTFLAMAEAFSWPVVGFLLRRTGQIPVTRGSASAADAMRPALEALEAGWVVALYPEGRITTEADYRPLSQGRTGAARLALTAGCPIVPVAQWGAHRLLTREHTSALTRRVRWLGLLRPGRTPRRPVITVLVGEPISIEELRAAAGTGPDLRAATDLVMARLRAMVGEIAAEDLPDLVGEGS